MKCDRRRLKRGKPVRCDNRDGLTRFTHPDGRSVALCVDHWHLAEAEDSFTRVWEASAQRQELTKPEPHVTAA